MGGQGSARNVSGAMKENPPQCISVMLNPTCRHSNGIHWRALEVTLCERGAGGTIVKMPQGSRESC